MSDFEVKPSRLEDILRRIQEEKWRRRDERISRGLEPAYDPAKYAALSPEEAEALRNKEVEEWKAERRAQSKRSETFRNQPLEQRLGGSDPRPTFEDRKGMVDVRFPIHEGLLHAPWQGSSSVLSTIQTARFGSVSYPPKALLFWVAFGVWPDQREAGRLFQALANFEGLLSPALPIPVSWVNRTREAGRLAVGRSTFIIKDSTRFLDDVEEQLLAQYNNPARRNHLYRHAGLQGRYDRPWYDRTALDYIRLNDPCLRRDGTQRLDSEQVDNLIALGLYGPDRALPKDWLDPDCAILDWEGGYVEE